MMGSFHGRHQVFSFQQRQGARSAQAVGIWRKYFLCSNQAGASPHERGIKIFEDYFSRRDLFCFCGKIRNPHVIWLLATSDVRIFVYEQVFRFGLIFQKQQNQSKSTNCKQETPSVMQALNFYFSEPQISRITTNKTEKSF
jgi:hypothetical protein